MLNKDKIIKSIATWFCAEDKQWHAEQDVTVVYPGNVQHTMKAWQIFKPRAEAIYHLIEKDLLTEEDSGSKLVLS